MGSAGVKVMSVVRDLADAYVHAGGQYQWDNAAPVAVARAAGLHCSPGRRLAAGLQRGRHLAARPHRLPSRAGREIIAFVRATARTDRQPVGDVGVPATWGMTSFVSHTTVDCANAYELSEWWKQLLGYVDVDGDPNLPGHEECMILDPETGHRILFIEVPDAQDGQEPPPLRPPAPSGTRDEEVERVRALGATEVGDHRGQYGPGTGWVVLADPEGNEFCILRSQAEVDAGWHRSAVTCPRRTTGSAGAVGCRCRGRRSLRVSARDVRWGSGGREL